MISQIHQMISQIQTYIDDEIHIMAIYEMMSRSVFLCHHYIILLKLSNYPVLDQARINN